MNSKQIPFQLEKTVPGTFLLQGLLGGVLGGFVAALIGAVAWAETNLIMTLDLTGLAVITGAIVGVIKAAFMRGVIWLTGIRYRVITRVTATTLLAFLSIAVMRRQADFDEDFIRGCLIWSLSVGIPVALLVGSRVKPWKLFTFGSIAVDDVGERIGSRRILATLATLPLRFGSILAMATLLLYMLPHFPKADFDDALVMSVFLSVALLYLLWSAYVSFRSPQKIGLVVLGIFINFPIILLTLIEYRRYLNFPHPHGQPLMVTVILSSFLFAWAIFLIARLSVKTNPASFLTINPNKSIAAAPNLDHHCLGSRFAEWQQRVA